MAPTICSDKKTQIRSGISDIRKQSNTSSLSTSPSSSINYAQKRKIFRPYPVRAKPPVDNSVYYISSSSDTSSDNNECLRSISPPSTPSSISDNSISTSTSSQSSHLSPISISILKSPFVPDDNFAACADRLNPFHHNIDSPSSVYSVSSSQDENHLTDNDDDTILRSPSPSNCSFASDGPSVVSSTMDNDKSEFRTLSKLQMQQQAKSTKGLFDIAIKMIKLVRRNQLLQRRLSQLQAETSEFIQSVLANPENRDFRNKVQAKSCCNREMT